MESSKPRGLRKTWYLAALGVLCGVVALGAVTSSADATETLPENTVAPTWVSQGSTNPPVLDQTVPARSGTWKGENLKYTYSWFSCAGGSCVERSSKIPTYIPIRADVGRNLKMGVTATNSVGSATAYTSLSYPVVEHLKTYVCKGGSETPEYENAECNKSGASNSYSWANYEGSVESSSPKSMILLWNEAGIGFEVDCKDSGSGKVAAAAGAIIGGYTVTWNLSVTNCVITRGGEAVNCQISNGGTMTTGPLSIATEGLPKSGVTKMKGTLTAGPLVSFKIENCPGRGLSFLEHEWSLKGWVPMEFSNSVSILSGYSDTTTNALKLNEYPTTVQFGSKLQPVGLPAGTALKFDTSHLN